MANTSETAEELGGRGLVRGHGGWPKIGLQPAQLGASCLRPSLTGAVMGSREVGRNSPAESEARVILGPAREGRLRQSVIELLDAYWPAQTLPEAAQVFGHPP